MNSSKYSINYTWWLSSTTHSPLSVLILEDVKIYIAISLKTRKVEQVFPRL